MDFEFSVPGTHYGRTILKQRKLWRRIGRFAWYRLLEPVIRMLAIFSMLAIFGLAMMGAAVLGAMFVFGAAGGLRLIGELMFS